MATKFCTNCNFETTIDTEICPECSQGIFNVKDTESNHVSSDIDLIQNGIIPNIGENAKSKSGIILSSKKFTWITLISICTAVLIASIYFTHGNKTNSTSSAATSKIYSPKGILVIPAQFDSVSPFGFLGGMSSYSTQKLDMKKIFTSDERWGLITKDGKILPPNFSYSPFFFEGYATVYVDKKSQGIIDKLGKWVLPPQKKFLANYSQGLVAFQSTNKKMGYMNLNGDVVISPQWDSASDFVSDRAELCNLEPTQHCGFIDHAGKVVIPLIYDDVNLFSEGYSVVCRGVDEKQVCGYIDKNGAAIVPLNTRSHEDNLGIWEPSLYSFSNGLAKFGGSYQNGFEKWGFVDTNFKIVIPYSISRELPIQQNSETQVKRTDDPWDFDTDIQWEVVGESKDNPGKSAAMDKQGNIKFFSTYEEVRPFSEGLSAVKINGKWGFINEKNEVVITPQFEFVGEYNEGMAAVKVNGKWGYID